MKNIIKDSLILFAITLLPLSAKLAMEGIVRKNQRMIEESGIEAVKAAMESVIYEGSIEQQKLASWRMRLREILAARGREPRFSSI